MKNAAILLKIVFLALFFVACGEKEIPELSVSTHSINLKAGVGTEAFYVNTNTVWNISTPPTWCQYEFGHIQKCHNSIPDWISINRSSDKKEIRVHATENTSYYRRWYEFTINAGNLSENVVVYQSGKPYLTTKQELYELDSKLHYQIEMEVEIYDGFFEIKSNVDWVSSFGYALATAKPGYTTLHYIVYFVVEENPSATEREGIITFTQENLSKTVTIKQTGKQ